MRIFISYAHEDRIPAENIAVRLQQEDHDVYFDRNALKPGKGYDEPLRREIGEIDLLIFLISPDSIKSGRYTMTELKFARERWPNPTGRILPVMVRETSRDDVPAFVEALGILQAEGNLPAEVVAEVEAIAEVNRHAATRKRNRALSIASVAVACVAIVALISSWPDEDPSAREVQAAVPEQPSAPVVSGTAKPCSAFPRLQGCKFKLATPICAAYARLDSGELNSGDANAQARRQRLYAGSALPGEESEAAQQFFDNIKFAFEPPDDVVLEPQLSNPAEYWNERDDALVALSVILNTVDDTISDGESRIYYGEGERTLSIPFSVVGNNWRITRVRHQAAFAYSNALRATDPAATRRYLDMAVDYATDVCAQ